MIVISLMVLDDVPLWSKYVLNAAAFSVAGTSILLVGSRKAVTVVSVLGIIGGSTLFFLGLDENQMGEYYGAGGVEWLNVASTFAAGLLWGAALGSLVYYIARCASLVRRRLFHKRTT